MEKQLDIVDIALSAETFSTLAVALGAAGLIEALRSEGPFTVFAPTDDAFAKIPAQALDDLLQPENREKLRAILTYHVVAGKVTSSDVGNLVSATTLQGQKLQINNQDGVKINGASLIASNIEATNGVIHVIDTVLMPATAAAA